MESAARVGEAMNTRPTAVSCKEIVHNLSMVLDRKVPVDAAAEYDGHFAECASCAHQLRSAQQLRSSLRSIPARMAPVALTTKLRVIGSHERLRRQRYGSPGALWRNWLADARLLFQNLMRPLAIPTFGGVTSSIILFSMLMPALATRVALTRDDIPTVLNTQVSLKNIVPLAFAHDEVVVELTIDGQGQIADYSIPDCQRMPVSPAMRRAIECNLLFTQFNPATTFGQPKAGKIRISYRGSSHIDVKG
jgi:hypothetical protein